nr:uncharacterized protein LOC113802540 [Penaeus vannamei]
MKIIVLACLAAVAVAAPQLEERVVELLRDDRVANEDGTFSYTLEADNGIKTAVSGSIGAEGQINQEGSYTFILARHPGCRHLRRQRERLPAPVRHPAHSPPSSRPRL